MRARRSVGNILAIGFVIRRSNLGLDYSHTSIAIVAAMIKIVSTTRVGKPSSSIQRRIALRPRHCMNTALARFVFRQGQKVRGLRGDIAP